MDKKELEAHKLSLMLQRAEVNGAIQFIEYLLEQAEKEETNAPAAQEQVPQPEV